ncbi:MAG: MlaD family protein [Brevinematia bacterium]
MYKFSTLEKIVGFIVVLSGFLLILLILFIGRAGDWFKPYKVYYSIVKNASGIQAGEKIYYKGITIGKIRKIKIQDNDTFLIELNIFSEYANKIKPDSLFISKSSLLGGKSYEITPGAENEQPLPEGSTIYSLDTYEGKVLAKLKGYYSPEEDINKIINNISLITSIALEYLTENGELFKTVVNLNKMLSNANLIVQRINTSTLTKVDNLIDTKIEKLVDELTITLVELQKILKDENIKKILKNTDKITSDLSQTTDEIKNNKTNITKILNNIEKLTSTLNELAKSLTSLIPK